MQKPKRDTKFEFGCDISSRYLATQKRENKSLNTLYIFIIQLPHKAILGKKPYAFLEGYFNHKV
jgi:hypothetical protein